MFFATYKNTLKNIVRAPTFWLLLSLFVFEIIQIIIGSSSSYYDFNLKEMIDDTDPRFVVGYRLYLKKTFNVVRQVMIDTMPLITVVSTVLVLNRDYGDNFYEIEKAAGIKPRHYLFGRLTALVTLLIGIGAVASLAYFHTYIFTRGGVPSLDLFTYFTDSTVRIMRVFLFTGLPCILFYIAFTYCIGAVCRNGIPAAVVSIGYVVLNSVIYTTLRYRLNPLILDYLVPLPNKLGQYFYSYDTEEFEGMLKMLDTSLEKAVICLCILGGCVVVYTTIAYLCTRKRDR